jgi:hypothetical protein
VIATVGVIVGVLNNCTDGLCDGTDPAIKGKGERWVEEEVKRGGLHT